MTTEESNMETPKTIKAWFNELPDPQRGRAFANTPLEMLSETTHTLSGALSCAFNWADSPEGKDYWAGIDQAALHLATGK